MGQFHRKAARRPRFLLSILFVLKLESIKLEGQLSGVELMGNEMEQGKMRLPKDTQAIL